MTLENGSTTRWRLLRAYVLRRDRYRCQIGSTGCTERAEASGAHAGHVDHIVPRELGGGDEETNLRASCRSCNLSRGRTSLVDEPAPRRVSSW